MEKKFLGEQAKVKLIKLIKGTRLRLLKELKLTKEVYEQKHFHSDYKKIKHIHAKLNDAELAIYELGASLFRKKGKNTNDYQNL